MLDTSFNQRSAYHEASVLAAQQLRKKLKTADVSESTITDIVKSGYHLNKISTVGMESTFDAVCDSFYGAKLLVGVVPFEHFIRYLKTGERWSKSFQLPRYRIKSVDEAIKILKSPRHKTYFESNRMCFRGQTKEYKFRRDFPNPIVADSKGYETLIIPSYWRKFVSSFEKRALQVPESILSSNYADDIIYYGIQNWEKISQGNTLGYYTLSELEHSPDSKSREYYKRWSTHKVLAGASGEPTLIEQHYGITTSGLDVTFDLQTAAFFSINKFTFIDPDKRVADYEPLEDFGERPVIYCFVFVEPPLSKTQEIVNRLNIFEHCPPLRPFKQECALPFFHPNNINEALVEIDAIFELDIDFISSSIPSKEELFPDRNEDLFYSLLLEQKRKYPDQFNQVIEYLF